MTDFGRPVHVWGSGLLFNSAIHPSSARRLTRSSDAEYWAEKYQVDREGHHLTDIDTAYTDVWNYETPVKHYVERVNTVDLNPDLSNPEFHGDRHSYTPDPTLVRHELLKCCCALCSCGDLLRRFHLSIPKNGDQVKTWPR